MTRGQNFKPVERRFPRKLMLLPRGKSSQSKSLWLADQHEHATDLKKNKVGYPVY
jgi:hypothetical protein